MTLLRLSHRLHTSSSLLQLGRLRLSRPTRFSPITEWGGWIYRLAKASADELAERDIAELNLRCAEGLPGTDDPLLVACLDKVNDWAKLTDEFTQRIFPSFLKNPQRFQGLKPNFE